MMIYQLIGLIIGIIFYLFMLIHPLIPKLRKRLTEYHVILFDASIHIEDYIKYESKDDKEHAIVVYVLLNVLLSIALSILMVFIWPLLILAVIGIYIINKQTNN